MNRDLPALHSAGWRGFLAPLRIGDFRRLWLANGLWWNSMFMEQVIFGWLALSLTDSAWWVALLGFFRSAPVSITGVFGATITERFQRRRVILCLQVSNLIGLGTIALLYWFGALAYWHLAAVSLANGAAWSMDWPTRRALIPDLVGRDRVVDGVLLDNVLQSASRIAGPLAAGAAMATLGARESLVLVWAASALSVGCLARLRTAARAPVAPRGLRESWQRVRGGLAYVAAEPRILGVVLVTVTMNVWAFPFQGLLPVFARDVLGRGPGGLGVLSAAPGLGVLLGLAVVQLARRRWANEAIYGWGSVLSGLGILLFALSTSFPLSALLLVVAGLGQACFSTMQSSITLMSSTDDMRARAMSAVVLAIGLGPLGRLQSGAMAALWSTPASIAIMALLAMGTTGAAMGLVPGFVRSSRSATSSG